MQKGFAPILILVGFLMLIGAVGGAYYLGMKASQDSHQQNPVITSDSYPQASASASVAPTPTPADETANWKTYTHATEGYLIKYPPTWSVIDTDSQNPSNTSVTINSNERFSFPDAPNSPEGITYWVNIDHTLNPSHKEFKDLVMTDMSPEIKNIFTYKTNVINGLTAYRTTTLPSQSGCDFVYFKKIDDSYIEINFCEYSPQKPYVQQDKFYAIFNKMLSTFKFTD